MTLTGVKCDPEILTDKGRIDGILITKKQIYIMEFKYGKKGIDTEGLAKMAIKQIKEKKYYEKFLKEKKKIIFLAVVFADKKIDYKVEYFTGEEK